MKKIKLTGKHILLLLLYSPGIHNKINEPIKSRTRIIKMMFLFKHEIKKDFLKNGNIKDIKFPQFIPWHYGPFSKEIYDDIEFFKNNDFIIDERLEDEMREFELDELEEWSDDFLFEDEKELLIPYYNEESFKLTNKGLDFVQPKIYNHLTQNQKNILQEFKQKINNSSLEAILRYTYLEYKEFAEKSKIKEKILG